MTQKISEIQVVDLEGKVVGSVQVPAALEGPVNEAVLWQAVRMYLANRREGNAETKTRGQVRGGGKKPWKQKHTGRARAGSSRSPIWRGGGVVFGPHPHDFRYELPAGVRKVALVNSLRDKVSSQAVVVLKSFEGIAPKTKVLALLLRKLQAEKKALLVVEKPSPDLVRISRNLTGVMAVKPASDLTCYDVLSATKLVVAAEAFKGWEALPS
ncbi:MAG: 50S ribosomal protein L4 [Candidatus Omnitrophota bacterium]|nr:50S ribosomal protein L4 [Candidatus Omnitrophota bacterium]